MPDGKSIQLSSRAQKDYKKLSDEMQSRVKSSLKNLASSKKKMDIKKLKGVDGREDLYRLCVGEYRIVYHSTNSDIFVLRIDKRSRIHECLD